MIGSRRLYLREIAEQGELRAAWEILVGPTDWDKARELEPQADEPEWGRFPSAREPGMVLTADAGLLPFLTEGDGPPTFRGKFFGADQADSTAPSEIDQAPPEGFAHHAQVAADAEAERQREEDQ